MALFMIKNNKIERLKAKQFKNEKELQTICEKNLEELFQVRFVDTEFAFGDEYTGRMDTIGLDFEGNPVIIEYKLDRNDAILSQALFYMDWLVNHRGDFEKVVHAKLGNDVEIVWDNPKMILVAQDYSKYDKYAVNRVDYDIYMYKYICYESGELYLENINVEENKKYALSTKNNEHKASNKDDDKKYERKEYNLEHLVKLANATDNTVELYNMLADKILEISDHIERKFNKYSSPFRTTRAFADVQFRKNNLAIFILPNENYDDPRNIIENVPESYKWNLSMRFAISSPDEVDYAISIIKQSYNLTV